MTKLIKLTIISPGPDIDVDGPEETHYFGDDPHGVSCIGKLQSFILNHPPVKLIAQGIDIYPKFVVEWVDCY